MATPKPPERNWQALARRRVKETPVELCMTSEQLGSLIPHDSQTSLLRSITLRSCYITKETLKFHHGAIS